MAVSVRKARGGSELRIEGALASVTDEHVASRVWRALALAALTLKARRPKVLVIGLGGGSVAHYIRKAQPNAEITAVEISSEVLKLARSHFRVGELDMTIIQADALDFLTKTRGRYDLIVEDAFVGPESVIHKPWWMPEPGLGLLLARRRVHGVLAVNTIHETKDVLHDLKKVRRERVALVRVRGYLNTICVVGVRPSVLRRKAERGITVVAA